MKPLITPKPGTILAAEQLEAKLEEARAEIAELRTNRSKSEDEIWAAAKYLRGVLGFHAETPLADMAKRVAQTYHEQRQGKMPQENDSDYRAKLIFAQRAKIAALAERVNVDNAVCACGCPLEDHESYGEEGESCEHDDHECIRTCVAIAGMLAKLRAERDEALAAPPAVPARRHAVGAVSTGENRMTETTTFALEEWQAEGKRRFGADQLKWAFVCPSCGHVATVDDWRKADAPNGAVAFSCVGRWAGAEGKTFGQQGGPCDYAGGGLFGLNPVSVDDGGNVRSVFAFAEVVTP